MVSSRSRHARLLRRCMLCACDHGDSSTKKSKVLEQHTLCSPPHHNTGTGSAPTHSFEKRNGIIHPTVKTLAIVTLGIDYPTIQPLRIRCALIPLRHFAGVGCIPRVNCAVLTARVLSIWRVATPQPMVARGPRCAAAVLRADRAVHDLECTTGTARRRGFAIARNANDHTGPKRLRSARFSHLFK